MLVKYDSFYPNLNKSVFVANGAKIIGDTTIDEYSSIWFNAVIRADVANIKIGKYTNIQDNSTIHVARALYDELGVEISPKTPCIIKDYVTIGHNSIIHACTINSNVLVGMGSVIMDGAVVNENSIIGANSLVTKNKVFPPNSLIQGSPAKVVRELSNEEIKAIKNQALEYAEVSKKYLENS
ncbi:gamma carbonic anhydrase family protein [Campylobacter sp. 2018MI13]|uniref:gamma carbonic anhydrase family protein n=1 Tax=Campylobacter sp. 2018MI13 TaxID=2836737 RepID=UPI001BDA9BF6|nr:gamma carbonic anhydrase family protein [Campylobacter sp. 2018MI13]MBT0882301.1 gamma carbonic anhydrase family protein [Campylobacter sp. 2018MI13]